MGESGEVTCMYTTHQFYGITQPLCPFGSQLLVIIEIMVWLSGRGLSTRKISIFTGVSLDAISKVLFHVHETNSLFLYAILWPNWHKQDINYINCLLCHCWPLKNYIAVFYAKRQKNTSTKRTSVGNGGLVKFLFLDFGRFFFHQQRIRNL